MSRLVFQKLSDGERVARARIRSGKLVEHVASLFLMHEANAAVIYSTKLSSQIPPSYAAQAFNQFQRSMHLFELIRLCALWDAPGTDRESIPTIIALFNEAKLIDHHIAEIQAAVANEIQIENPGSYGRGEKKQSEKSWWLQDRKRFAEMQAASIRTYLTFAAEKTAAVQASAQLKALRRLRDAYIAHNLDLVEPDIQTEAPVQSLQYGEEAKMLDDTVAVANALHHGLNQTAFDWEGSRTMARRNSLALWDNCTFQIPSRRKL